MTNNEAHLPGAVEYTDCIPPEGWDSPNPHWMTNNKALLAGAVEYTDCISAEG